MQAYIEVEKKRNCKIGIIGLGYVGLTLAIAAATTEHIEVYGVEKNEHIKSCIKSVVASFFEPGLDVLIQRTYNKSFFVVDEFPDKIKLDAIIITVGTPLASREDKTPDFTGIQEAMRDIKKVYRKDTLVILRSTVSIGTTRNTVIPYFAEVGGQDEKDVLAAMCPERTLEGKAVYELSNLPQIISGNNQKSVDIARKIFGYITPSIVEANSLEEAELIKLYCNAYRDMHFALGNLFCIIAQHFSVDGIQAIKHANHGYPRSNIPNPGFVAGPCLEKDAYILINNMPESESKSIILNMRKYNEMLEDRVVSWVQNKIGTPDEKKIITISGMAFKGQPETSDLRGSSSVYVARKLCSLGYRLYLHDYVAYKNDMEKLCIGTVYEDLKKACKDSVLLLIMNNNIRYSVLTPDMITDGGGKIEVLDVWGMCTELQHTDGFGISTIGNMFIE